MSPEGRVRVFGRLQIDEGIVNEIYKENKDPELMDLMKRLTVIKKKIEVRLKGRSQS